MNGTWQTESLKYMYKKKTCMSVVAEARQWQSTWQLKVRGWVVVVVVGRVSLQEARWQHDRLKKNLHSASGRKPRLPKRLTQESSQTVSSAVPSTNTPHRLDTPGFPLCWQPSPKTFLFLLLSEQSEKVSSQWLLRERLLVHTSYTKPHFPVWYQLGFKSKRHQHDE